MFHPVGSQPPSVYWRRRFTLLASLVALVVLTAWVLHSGGTNPQAAAHSSTSPPARTTAAVTSPPASSTAAVSTSAAVSAASTAARSTKGAPPAHPKTTAAPVTCTLSVLTLAASTGQPSYHVGDQPELILRVTNPTAKPCTQSLSDSDVELRVYNGASRVWGSNDCKVDPMVVKRTLTAHGTVAVSIVWSGLSSQPNCAGTRQRVGAGSYTVYGLLDGRMGTAAQFSMS